jgi:cellulose synthase/poly-beta-1,6-N-acetylglucosamine synthase-like glycosyltransferase
MAILAASAPTAIGLNFLLWCLIGLFRFATEMFARLRGTYSPPHSRGEKLAIKPEEVAVIMAARNEEASIGATIEALKKNVPVQNIYIGSDASTDRTVAVAQLSGCTVDDIRPNRGKARVLVHLLRQHRILERYRAVLIMDAEVIVSENYLTTILPYFNDPEVVAFVSHAHTRWEHQWRLSPRMLYTAYRMRMWLILYYGLRYGQTWKHACATPIIPGGSSVYRSSALANIEIDTPGYLIEDFHMTFQVYHKRLGRIASHPSAFIIDQEPYTLRDYVSQIERWYVGFWQTLIRHGYWPSFFWFATVAFTIEMFMVSVLVTALPLLAIMQYVFHRTIQFFPAYDPLSLGVIQVPITLTTLLLTILIGDYLITAIVAILKRKPAMLIYGLFFFVLRYLDSIVFLWSLPLSFLMKSSGRWVSPARQHADVPL